MKAVSASDNRLFDRILDELPSRADYLRSNVDAKTCTKAEAVEYAISCAERVIHIFTDKHPNNNKPQQAIDAAKCWLRDPRDPIEANR